ncbi:MAG: thioesterase family protein [Rhodospirillales bacterium]|nr:thioesterase family protein [Rhodospirillales bacterium]
MTSAFDRHDPARPPAPEAAPALFVHRRRLTFGDTDAARIVYTPRVAHFAVEAIEAWFLERIDVSWLHINRAFGFGTPVVRMEVDFVSMMRPPDLLDTVVALTKIGGSSLAFRLAGSIGARLCYRAHVVTVFASPEAGRKVPIPDAYRPALARELALSASGPSVEDPSLSWRPPDA